MAKLPRGEKAARAIGFMVCVGLTGVFEWGLQLRHNEQLAQERLLALTFASSLRANIDRELYSLFTLTASLSSYLEIRAADEHIDDAEVNALLAHLYKKSHHVRNFGLAVGYRLTYVYPLKGNEQAVGLYYPDVPKQWPAVQRTIADRTGTLAGPVNLVQGGSALIYRVPVFIDGRYWGLLSTVIDAQGLLRSVMQRDMLESLDFAIRGRDGLGEKGDVFWGDPRLFDDPDTVRMLADVPDGHWQYAVRVPKTISPGLALFEHLLVFAVCALLGYFVYQLLRQRYELALIARLDPLTHVTNRRAFENIIEGALRSNRKLHQDSFVLLFLDLNRFKFINDNYGHDAGDAVLAALAGRLREVLRDDDVIGRWGGDEFVALLRHSSPAATQQVVDRIRAILSEPVNFEGVEHSVGVSIGVAVYPQDGDNLPTLIRIADERMYSDKQSSPSA